MSPSSQEETSEQSLLTCATLSGIARQSQKFQLLKVLADGSPFEIDPSSQPTATRGGAMGFSEREWGAMKSREPTGKVAHREQHQQREVEMHFISDILKKKGHRVFRIGPDKTILEATRRLKTKDREIGALVVLDRDHKMMGIISERDIIHGIQKYGDRALGMRVKDLMTKRVVTCKPTYTINEAMRKMIDRKRPFRHLPVMKDGKLTGLVSISDVVKARIDDLLHQIRASTVYNSDHGHA